MPVSLANWREESKIRESCMSITSKIFSLLQPENFLRWSRNVTNKPLGSVALINTVRAPVSIIVLNVEHHWSIIVQLCSSEHNWPKISLKEHQHRGDESPEYIDCRGDYYQRPMFSWGSLFCLLSSPTCKNFGGNVNCCDIGLIHVPNFVWLKSVLLLHWSQVQEKLHHSLLIKTGSPC